MQNFLKEKLNLEKRKRRRNNIILVSFILVMIFGYAAFFSSSYLMPKHYRIKELTAIGKTYTSDDFVASVDSWDYSKSEKSMQVIMEVNAISMDTEPSFRLRCGSTIIPGKNIKKIEPNYYIVDFKKLPYNWTEASMTVAFGDKYIKFATNDKEIESVEEIKRGKDADMIVYATEAKIKGLQKHYGELEKLIDKQSERKLAVYEKLDAIVNAPVPTEEKEKQVYENQKAAIRREVDEADADLMDTARQQAAVQKKIEEEQQKLQGLKENK